MCMLVLENLEIEIELPMYQVESFYIKIAPNRHGNCKIFGVLSKNLVETILTEQKDMDIHIKYDGKTLFRGFVEEIIVRPNASVYHFELSAYTYSKKMDLEKRTELFQDVDRTYTTIAQDILVQ